MRDEQFSPKGFYISALLLSDLFIIEATSIFEEPASRNIFSGLNLKGIING